MSIRHLQVIGAIAIRLFSRKYALNHESISSLVCHLLDVMTAENLPEWEQQGARQDLTGRGDPLPPDLEKLIPSGLRKDFYTLVECAVEIGLSSMYGASTEQALYFVKKTQQILRKHNIEGLDDLASKYLHCSRLSWGKPFGEDEVEQFRSLFN